MPRDNRNISNEIAKRSEFDQYIKEVDARDIPNRYVDKVIVYFNDLTNTQLPPSLLPKTIQPHDYNLWMSEKYKEKGIADVKIFINTHLLERDVRRLLQPTMGKYF